MRKLLVCLLILVLTVTSALTIVPEVKALSGAASFCASGTASWTNICTTGPPSRYGAGMVYDAADGYVLLFGGCCTGSPFLGDTWKFSAGSWTKLDISGPSARFLDAGMVYDAADGYVLLFGGQDASSARYLGDTWKFSAGVWTNLAITGPSPRDDFGLAYDAADGYVVLYGGVGG